MAVVTDRVARATGVPLGINVLANAPIPAFAIAMAGGAKFIRVNQWANAYVANEGFIEGRAAEALRYRSLLRAEHIKVFADSHVKHGSHAIVADRSIQELTRDLAFFDADVVIATGQRTGNTATIAEIEEIGAATHLPLLVGSGVDKDNVAEILKRTNGVDRCLVPEAGRRVVEPGRSGARACIPCRSRAGAGGTETMTETLSQQILRENRRRLRRYDRASLRRGHQARQTDRGGLRALSRL